MDDRTIDAVMFVGIRLTEESILKKSSFYTHLIMNNYTYYQANLSQDNVPIIFVSEDEIDYVLTILEEHDVKYEFIN